MTVRLEDRARQDQSETRITRSPWRIRGVAGAAPVVDTRRALLLWEARPAAP